MKTPKTKKAVIFGTGAFAELVHFNLSHYSEYEVVGFTVTHQDKNQDTFKGLKIVAFTEIEKIFPPSEYELFIAVGYRQRNKLRAKFYKEAKAKGYQLLSFVSPFATVFSSEIGDNCFIFEDNTIQPFVTIGNNVILWSGNHIGHHSVIEDHVFISSHVVVSGYCRIGAYSFIGVNASLRDGITIGRESIIGAGALVMHDTQPRQVVIGIAANSSPATAPV